MYASFASSDGRAILVLGAPANSTTSIVALDGHLQTFATIVITHNGFNISCLALGFVGLERIERF